VARIEKTVFICYRRTNVPWALAIFQNLRSEGFDVFFDFTGIGSGDFEHIILDNIRARAHFLVLLTPSALEGCDRPDDWLRLEIETALSSQRNIVPIMLDGFDFYTPTIADQLTGTIAPLKRYQALEVPSAYFLEAMTRLRDTFLNVALEAVLQPASPFAQQVSQVEQKAAEAAPAVQSSDLTVQKYLERAVETKDVADKIRFYSEVLRLRNDDVSALNNRGVLRQQSGDLTGAKEDFDAAIRHKPSWSEPFHNRGWLRYLLNDLAGASEDFDTAISREPRLADAFNHRGNLRRQLGDLNGAREDFDAAILIDRNFADAYKNRGWLRHQQGDLAGAEDDFKMAAQLGLSASP